MRSALVATFATFLALTNVHAQSQRSADTVGASWEYDSQLVRYRVEVVATGVRVPFGMAFLPDSRALVTDRPGTLWLLDIRTGAMTRVAGAPAVSDSVDGGLLDIEVHPDYTRNGWLYFSYSEKTDTGKATVVERARLRDARLVDRQRLFTAYPAVAGDYHFGSRLALKDGYLFITLGERELSASPTTDPASANREASASDSRMSAPDSKSSTRTTTGSSRVRRPAAAIARRSRYRYCMGFRSCHRTPCSRHSSYEHHACRLAYPHHRR